MKSFCPACSGSLIAALLILWGPPEPVAGQQDTDAATRQYAAAVALQNRQVYDLAAEAWVKFLADFKDDSRVDRALHHLGVCYYQENQLQKAPGPQS